MKTLSVSVILAFALSTGLTACGGGSSTATKLCQQYSECEPAEFAQDYDSVAECRAEFQAELDAQRQIVTPACYSAAIRYFNCSASLDCNADPEVHCAESGAAAEEACSDITDPCPGYVSGTDDDECCQVHDPCGLADDQACDCSDTCSWDTADCATPQ